MIRESIQEIAGSFSAARAEVMAQHPLAQFIRDEAPKRIKDVLGPRNLDLQVKGGHGQFKNWAEVPWIAIFDPLITTKAGAGYYPVYLFAANMDKIYLSLNQATHEAELEFGGAGARKELPRRAALIRARVPEYAEIFSAAPIELNSTNDFPLGYEAGHAFGVAYDPSFLPDEAILARDLGEMIRLYRTLTSRGGVDGSIDPEQGSENQSFGSLLEKRQYRYHRRVERNARLVRDVKRAHGDSCEACGFNFGEYYGEFADGYIEAHHIVPLAELPEGESVRLDPQTDFAVLCANCHRMIHRKDGPKDVEELGALIRG